MAETKNFVESVLKKATVSDEREWRKAFILERQESAQAFSLRLWLKDGRRAQALHWSHYITDEYRDDGEQWESLSLLFDTCVVRIKGRYFKRLLDGIDEGKLRILQEQDSAEIKAITRHNEIVRANNLDKRTPSDLEAMIADIQITPDFETVAKNIESEEKDK